MDDADISIRVSDQDRSDTMQQLCEGFAQGRLDQAEFVARTDRALAATNWAELHGLTGDLPVDQRTVRRREQAELLMEVRWWIAGAVVTNGIWLVQSLIAEHDVRYWPGLPLAIWGLILIGAVIVPRSASKKVGSRPVPEIGPVEAGRGRTQVDGSPGDAPPTGAV